MTATWAEVRPTAPPVGRTRRTLLRGLPIAPSVVLLRRVPGRADPRTASMPPSPTWPSPGQVGTQFVGFANFTRAFTDPAFLNSVWLTVVFTLVSAIIGQNVLGMVLALLMRSGYAVVRALTSAFVIGAWVLPEVVAAYLWQAVLGPDGSWNTSRACSTFHRRTGSSPCRSSPSRSPTSGAARRSPCWSTPRRSRRCRAISRRLRWSTAPAGPAAHLDHHPAGPADHRDQPDADHACRPCRSSG